MRRALGSLRPSVRALPLWILLVLLALGLRAPLLRLSFCGEEGTFASAVLDVTYGHRPQLLVARNLDGKRFTTPPGHNLAGYTVPALLAAPVRAIAGFRTDAQRARFAILLRGCFAVLWALALVLACLSLEPDRRLAGAALLVAASLFTLPLLGSVQIQYDGAVSTLLLAAELALIGGGRGEEGRAWRWALAGLLLSTGKLEMAAVGLGAAAITAAWTRRLPALGAFVGAMLFGFVSCYLIDPDNFIGGYNVPQRFWGMQVSSGSSLSVRVRSYLATMWPLIRPAFVGAGLGLVSFLFSSPIERRRAITALAAATGLCLGYSIMAWQGDGFPRYFAPSFVLVPVALAALWPRKVTFVVAGLVAVFASFQYRAELVAGPLAMCSRLHGSDPRPQLRRSPPWRPACVPTVDSESATGFYSATAPFACCGAQWAGWPELTPQLCRQRRP